ncbi:MAG TPA: acyl-CoA thioesterase/bile acid-CoA:amino acid N-acyltransferase family protein [Acidobacteriaceae bacterium]|nr:acyl-CoA thioesterase/bile acid-CoA:amino acid N-acyltransferase family protein [Acidobacteriaceae bacterium]
MKFRAIPAVCLGAAAALPIAAQKIEIYPSTVLIDQVPSVRVTGLAPGATITLAADLIDGADHPWNSAADFTADAQGVVDLATQAPVKGSYRDASAMGLVWSMRSPARDAHMYVMPHELAAQAIHFHLIENGKPVADADLTQRILADGVSRVRLEGQLHGTLFVPPGDGLHPAVLVLGGSEGGLSATRAAWLASHGYAALALAYFRYEGLPDQLRDIPLEYFGAALGWLKSRSGVDPNRIAVLGTSRGGELALQLGSMYPIIHAVVAYVPANVRYPSCCGRPFGAAWTLHGEPLAWAAPGFNRDPARTLAAGIAVEHTHGPMLMIGGESDGVWPSSEMVHAAADRLRQEHFSYPVVTLIYPDAGHRAGMPAIIPAWHNAMRHPASGTLMDLGGTPEGNAASTLDAIPKVLDFLKQSLAAPVTPVSAASSAQP